METLPEPVLQNILSFSTRPVHFVPVQAFWVPVYVGQNFNKTGFRILLLTEEIQVLSDHVLPRGPVQLSENGPKILLRWKHPITKFDRTWPPGAILITEGTWQISPHHSESLFYYNLQTDKDLGLSLPGMLENKRDRASVPHGGVSAYIDMAFLYDGDPELNVTSSIFRHIKKTSKQNRRRRKSGRRRSLKKKRSRAKKRSAYTRR